MKVKKEPSLTLIKTLDEIDTIWRGLKDAYGDAKVMLSRKLQEISKLDFIKTSNTEKLISELSKVINVMFEVWKLAKDHHISTMKMISQKYAISSEIEKGINYSIRHTRTTLLR